MNLTSMLNWHYMQRICAFLMTSLLTAPPTIAHSAVSTTTPPVPTEHNLRYTTPAATWDEALPLGNGIMGALVWGDGAPLNISLDRTDLWDLRPIPEFQSAEYSYPQLRRWREEGQTADIGRIYDKPYMERPAPTKIPAGRLRLKLPGTPAFESCELDLQSAIASVRFSGGSTVKVLVHAAQPVGLLSVTTPEAGSGQPQLEIAAPRFNGAAEGREVNNGDYGDLASLGYPAPVETAGPNWRAFVQQCYGGFSFAVYAVWHQKGDGWEAAWSVAPSTEGTDPLAVARQRAMAALDIGFGVAAQPHRAWWRQYWQQSALHLPNKLLERQWYLEQYKFGAAARRGSPPVTLQGPWTADDGKLPPWKGDYHHDLNTQLTYWPCYSANHLEEGLGFLEWLWKTRPNNIAWAKNFWKLPGLNVPGVSDFSGNAMGGWPQYSFSGTTGCWLAQHFYLHWRYSQDKTFLRERAYPYLSDVATFTEALTAEKDRDGKRTLPLSTSPEIGDNRLEAWHSTITNHDLALIRWLFGAATELATELKLPDEAKRWQAALGEMPELAVAEDGRLLVARGVPLKESHRHFAHLMALHPLGLIKWEDGAAAQRTYRATLAELKNLGPEGWTGFSWAWLANLQARAHDGAGAEKTLEIFSTAFTLRNSFHANGDQSGKGYSGFTYRPFTLEGNFAAAAGIQEMLLQSYGGTLRIFPAIPAAWQDVSFHSLRAEGAFLVSARLEAGKVTMLQITAEQGGECRLVSPFSGKTLSLHLKRGQSRSLTKDP